MSDDNKYTIGFRMPIVSHGLMAGDCIDLLTGAIVMGNYCMWPKQEPRVFVVVDENRYNAYPGMMPSKSEYFDRKFFVGDVKKPIKFYQTLNRKKW